MWICDIQIQHFSTTTKKKLMLLYKIKQINFPKLSSWTNPTPVGPVLESINRPLPQSLNVVHCSRVSSLHHLQISVSLQNPYLLSRGKNPTFLLPWLFSAPFRCRNRHPFSQLVTRSDHLTQFNGFSLVGFWLKCSDLDICKTFLCTFSIKDVVFDWKLLFWLYLY